MLETRERSEAFWVGVSRHPLYRSKAAFVSTEIRPRVFLNSITVQAVSSLLRFIQHVGNTRCILACIASVSVRFSARLRRVSLFGGVKVGASATLISSPFSISYVFALAPIFARSRSEKCFKPVESPTETLAMQARCTAKSV